MRWGIPEKALLKVAEDNVRDHPDVRDNPEAEKAAQVITLIRAALTKESAAAPLPQ
jgi:hypothetical protein